MLTPSVANNCKRRVKLKAVIFDMDGVIIDSMPLHMQIEQDMFEEYGIKISKEDHETFAGKTDYYMWGILKERFHIEPSIDELTEMKVQRFIEKLDEVKLEDGIYEFILTVHREKYKLALASSNDRKIVDEVLKKFNLSEYIQVSVSGQEVVKGKPDPEIFLKAAEMLGVQANNCIVIEDAFAGVRAAKAAGMKCVGYRNPHSGNQDLSEADLIVDSLREISLDMIRKLLGEG